MRVTFRIPTETYAYVEVSEEISDETEPVEINNRYEDLKSGFAAKPGVSRKDFNTFIDNQLQEKGNDSEVYAAMSERQILVVQEVKKAMARLSTKQ